VCSVLGTRRIFLFCEKEKYKTKWVVNIFVTMVLECKLFGEKVEIDYSLKFSKAKIWKSLVIS
jgi:hypothetical protein